MNKTVIFLAFVGMAMLGFAGIVFIVHFRPDATATIISTVTSMLAVISGFAVTVAKLNQVEKQTNGRLSSRDARIRELEHMLIKRGINPHEPEAGTVKRRYSRRVARSGRS